MKKPTVIFFLSSTILLIAWSCKDKDQEPAEPVCNPGCPSWSATCVDGACVCDDPTTFYHAKSYGCLPRESFLLLASDQDACLQDTIVISELDTEHMLETAEPGPGPNDKTGKCVINHYLGAALTLVYYWKENGSVYFYILWAPVPIQGTRHTHVCRNYYATNGEPVPPEGDVDCLYSLLGEILHPDTVEVTILRDCFPVGGGEIQAHSSFKTVMTRFSN